MMYSRTIVSVITSIPKKLKNNSIPFKDYLYKSPFFKKKIFIPALFVILLIFFLLVRAVSEPSAGEIPTYKVKKGQFLISITESGEIRAKNSISISTPRVRGTIKIIYLIPEGTYVHAGDTVAKFDPSESLNLLRTAEANLNNAIAEKEKLMVNHKSQNVQMESDLKNAELTYELSKLSLEQIKFEAEVKQQQAKLTHQQNELTYNKTKKDFESKKLIQKFELNQAEITLNQRKAELENAKSEFNLLTLTAPMEGLVVYENNWSNNGRKFSIGDNVWPGMNIITLPDLSAMESITNVNEVDVSKVRKGQKVQVKLDAFQDSLFNGEIRDVASLGKSKNRNSSIKVFEIVVAIKDKSALLKPGMTTSNKIIVNEIPHTIYIPQEAVFERNAEKFVYVKDGTNFKKCNVELGEKGEDFIAIKKGLPEGCEVALRDPTIELNDNLNTSSDQGSSLSIPNQQKK